jgi:hypothetical protein
VLEFPFCLCRLEVSLGFSDTYWKPWKLLVHIRCNSIGVCYCNRVFEDGFSKGKGCSCIEVRDSFFCAKVTAFSLEECCASLLIS